MIAIIKRPGEHYKLTLIENKLSEIMEIVGGEYATHPVSETACFVYNPNALKEGRRFNFGSGKRDFFGTVLLCGVRNGVFTDLPNIYREAILLLEM